MPATARYIDPATGDYTVTDGAPTEDRSVVSAAVLALRMRRGSCAVLPAFGSRLHTLTKVSPQTARLAIAYTREALALFVERREMLDLRVKPVVGKSSLHLEISFRNGRRSGPVLGFRHAVIG